MFPVTVGLNHRTAPLEVRERLSFRPSKINHALTAMKEYPGLQGIVLLSTCNRLEIYASTDDVELGINSIKQFLAKHSQIEEQELHRYLYTHALYDCVRHLYHVVSGLDSMVLGETEILGQVSHAYEAALKARVTNKVMNVLFQNALTVGKRIRLETAIDQHPTSVSYTAVELAKQKVGSLNGKKILVVGAGEMSCLTAKYLAAAGASTIMVSNRSYQKALELAEEVGGKAYSIDDMYRIIPGCDIVISATAANHYVIRYLAMQSVMERREFAPLLMIDIAVPRDIEPQVGQIPGITLLDIDQLNGVIDEHQKAREQAALRAEKIIEEEMARFLKWHNSLYVIPTIVSLQDKARQIKDAQLNQALRRLGNLSEKQENIIRSMANSIVNQLLHSPISNLRIFADTRQGHLYTEILQNLFDLKINVEDSPVTWSEAEERQERAE